MNTTNELIQFTPCDVNEENYKSIPIEDWQKDQISLLVQQAPSLLNAAESSKAYIVKFPKGVNGVLTKLNQGGYSTALKGPDSKFVGSASLFPLENIATFSTCFSIMSMVTGQYYLNNIHNDLNLLNQKVDKIIGFLYGDKKAELLAELSFVTDAYTNYSTFIFNDYLINSTLSNIQAAKIIAMKDIEFYLDDLLNYSKTPLKKYSDCIKLIQSCKDTKDSLFLTLQLYVMCSVLEIQYSKNFNPSYVNYEKSVLESYLDKCNTAVLTTFNYIKGKKETIKVNKFIDKNDTTTLENKLEEMISSFVNNSTDLIKMNAINQLDNINSQQEFLITENGDLKIKTN